MKLDLSGLSTETVNPKSENLSNMSILSAVELMNEEDYNAVRAVGRQKDNIARVIEKTSAALSDGGRIIYCGAGTSGRLGVLDAVECPPTFGVDYETVIGLIAGGENAFVKAKEGAEDSKEQGADALKEIHLNGKDCVIGIAASGRTPYVIGALEYAKKVGAACAAVVCNANSPIAALVEDPIEIIPGPEVLTGSTRLKAGTATKMVLNMISTISMVQAGKVFRNYMVDVKATNEKLVQRAKNIIAAVTGCSAQRAEQLLEESGRHVKTAVIMELLQVPKEEAIRQLEDHQGHIERVLQASASSKAKEQQTV